jgi:misacylated tRNA(Ala) deacylase
MGGGCELGNAVLFRDYPYLTGVAATVLEVDDRGGIILDKTVFYITGGGQPGDSDVLKCAEGAPVEISTAVYGDGDQIVHVPAEGGSEPAAGRAGRAALIGDGDTDTCASGLHVLTVVLPFPVTGGRIGREEAHLDFDIEGPVPSKDEVQYRLNELLVQDRSESSEWITDEELLANPGIIKTRAVKPPIGTGRVRRPRPAAVWRDACALNI